MATREELAQKALATMHKKKLKWADVAATVGKSKEWTCAAVLGQMAMSEEEATAAAAILDLGEEAVDVWTTVPYRGSLPSVPPTDPLTYRFYELLMVYGTTLKSLINEEFGDGIMSAIDFQMDVQRVEDPKGDRVQIVFNGKFLPYKKY